MNNVTTPSNDSLFGINIPSNKPAPKSNNETNNTKYQNSDLDALPEKSKYFLKQIEIAELKSIFETNKINQNMQ
jgi:hypothetical protein